jgi:hypothetical protein
MIIIIIIIIWVVYAESDLASCRPGLNITVLLILKLTLYLTPGDFVSEHLKFQDSNLRQRFNGVVTAENIIWHCSRTG